MARTVLIKLLISLVLLPVVRNREEWYNTIGLNPIIILALIPSTLIYYNYILPQIVGIKLTLLNKIDDILGKEELLYSWFISFIRIIVSLLQWVDKISPYRLSKNLTALVNSLNNTPINCNKQIVLNRSYTDFRLIDPNYAFNKTKIRHRNFMESIPKITPMKISVPLSYGGNHNHLVYVRGSINYFLSNINKHYNKVYNIIKALNNQKVKFYLLEENIAIELKMNNSSMEIMVTDSNDKHIDFTSYVAKYSKDLPIDIYNIQKCKDSVLNLPMNFYNKTSNIFRISKYKYSLLDYTNPSKWGYNLTVNMLNYSNFNIEAELDSTVDELDSRTCSVEPLEMVSDDVMLPIQDSQAHMHIRLYALAYKYKELLQLFKESEVDVYKLPIHITPFERNLVGSYISRVKNMDLNNLHKLNLFDRNVFIRGISDICVELVEYVNCIGDDIQNLQKKKNHNTKPLNEDDIKFFKPLKETFEYHLKCVNDLFKDIQSIDLRLCNKLVNQYKNIETLLNDDTFNYEQFRDELDYLQDNDLYYLDFYNYSDYNIF